MYVTTREVMSHHSAIKFNLFVVDISLLTYKMFIITLFGTFSHCFVVIGSPSIALHEIYNTTGEMWVYV